MERPFSTGEIIDGKYRIERVVGEGGMGLVAEATHIALDQKVALKFLRPEMLDQPEIVTRFDREARAAVKLKSEHVARVMDVGKTRSGCPYMVMELLEGNDLADEIAAEGPLPIAQAVEYLIEACEGVGEAHARGIVHRDIKPENLFLTRRADGWRSVKVLDFGISKAVFASTDLAGEPAPDMSTRETRSIMGSPLYMSPEQLRSTGTVDHRADVWSLGIVLFELITGAQPFTEKTDFAEHVMTVLEEPHHRLGDFVPRVPEELEQVLDRCLEKDRERRFQSTAELAVALLPFAPKRARVIAERAASMSKAVGLSAPTLYVPSTRPPPPMEGRATTHPHVRQTTLQALETLPPPRNRSRTLLMTLGGATLVVVVVAVAMLSRSELRPASPTTRQDPAPSQVPTPVVTAPSERRENINAPAMTTPPPPIATEVARPVAPKEKTAPIPVSATVTAPATVSAAVSASASPSATTAPTVSPTDVGY